MSLIPQQLQVAFLLAGRLVLGAIFVQSGWEKFFHLEEFYAAAQAYKVLPPSLTHFYAVMVPWLEVLAGGYLVLGMLTRYAAGLASGLMLSFVIAISIVLIRGDAVDCGCFVGGRSEPVDVALLIRDLFLLGLSVLLVAKPYSPLSVDAWLAKRNGS